LRSCHLFFASLRLRVRLFFLFLFLVNIAGGLCFAQSPNYANGNGTIIETKTEDGVKWVFRKHIQRIKITDMDGYKDFNIYDKPSLINGTIISKIEMGDTINILQVADAITAKEYYVFLYIETEKKVRGWIFFGKGIYEHAEWNVPYFNNRWEIMEKIRIREKTWTVRKMIYQHVSIWEVLNIRDKPGLVDTKVISKVIPSPKEALNHFLVSAATEERETIDGKTDRWLKITYNGIEGWVFGGYTGVERGGPKYYIPEDMIHSTLDMVGFFYRDVR